MNQSYKTAMNRKKLSTPMQYLKERGLIGPNGLDYGSGKGNDADLLTMDKYDPYYQPIWPNKTDYDTITCNYVLNVINHHEIEETICKMIDLLAIGGNLYISVRNDIKGGQQAGKGCIQYNVTIPTSKHYNYKQIKKTSNYRLYQVTPTWR